ncbi:MAG: fibrobacter succinogenes major paralogous domain-containing protein, partial [Paludibacter sp.]
YAQKSQLINHLLSRTQVNTTYYVRAYASNSAGTAYGAEISFTTLARPVAVTDIDGNVYTSVTIGTQTWMVENLKTTHYRNGDVIANITDNTAWVGLTSGAWCDYANTAANGTKYGHLYNWYAVSDARNIAPVGWHVATDAEWITLTNYLGGTGVTGGKLKETGTGNWLNPNTGATNETGFSAFPGGYRNGGTFSELGSLGHWWTSTESDTNNAFSRSILWDASDIFRGEQKKSNGYANSVRCVKDNVPTITITTTASSEITATTATCGGNITSDSGATITARGICWSTSVNPTVDLATKTTEAGTTGAFTSIMTNLTPKTTYYVRAYATNSVGTAYGAEISFTTQAAPVGITDIDGNVYTSVTIGTQTWMVENLKTTHYRNGDAIANVTDNTAWSALSTGAWCDYANTAANGTKYGHLYNWFAVADSRIIAPVGWHIATDVEWATLTTYLGGADVAGGKLKEIGTGNWLSPNTSATNESGFSALPGGYRFYYSGNFDQLGIDGSWWMASEYDTNYAWNIAVYNNYSNVYMRYGYKMFGFSVRCIRDSQ